MTPSIPADAPLQIGMLLQATMTLAECPALEVLFVPGGAGVVVVMEDAVVLDFLANHGALRHLGLHGIPRAGRCRAAERIQSHLPLDGRATCSHCWARSPWRSAS